MAKSKGCDSAKAKGSLRCRVRDVFHAFAQRTSEIVGSPWSFLISMTIIAVWAVTGPAFRYSDTWQLIINTGTTIVTFLMVFLIQNTQNRDAKAIHLKLDELIRAQQGARNELVDLEKLSEDDLSQLEKQFERIREKGIKGSVNVAKVEEVEEAVHTAKRKVEAMGKK